MERVVFANVELRPKIGEACKVKHFPWDDKSCKFSSCEISSCFYGYPLKIIFPSSVTDGCCQWLYPIIYGGGLVEGDNINLSVDIGKNCCILFATLSYPKVYCCETGSVSQQHVKYTVEPGALLCILPDPLVCYKQASYIQTQAFHLAGDSNLVLLDWFTSGRYSRGEQWLFSRLKSISSVYINEGLAFKEAQNLQNTPFLTISRAMKSYNIFGICMIIGYLMEPLWSTILSNLSSCKSYGEKPKVHSLFAVSPLYLEGASKPCGCIIRFSSETVSEAVKRIEEYLGPLFVIIGGNPFKNK